jgi:hypothetical protein
MGADPACRVAPFLFDERLNLFISKGASMTLAARTMVTFLGCSALVLGTLAGCNSGTLPVAKTSGTITHDGKPVDGGMITFAPLSSGKDNPGKPASGEVDAGGEFVLTTYTDGDGAVIGKHRVTYNPPATTPAETPAGGHVQQAPPSKYAGLVVKEAEVEVKPGENTFEFHLVPVGQ